MYPCICRRHQFRQFFRGFKLAIFPSLKATDEVQPRISWSGGLLRAMSRRRNTHHTESGVASDDSALNSHPSGSRSSSPTNASEFPKTSFFFGFFCLKIHCKNLKSHRTAHHSSEAGPCMLLNSIFYQKMVRYAIKDTIPTVVMVFLSTLSTYARLPYRARASGNPRLYLGFPESSLLRNDRRRKSNRRRKSLLIAAD